MRDCIVLDAGPITYSSIEVLRDRLDLETALRSHDLEPEQTKYRLIEIPLSAVDVFPWLDRWVATGYAQDAVDALAGGATMPPIVGRVAGEAFSVFDGVHRLCACAALGRPCVQAYDLLP